MKNKFEVGSLHTLNKTHDAIVWEIVEIIDIFAVMIKEHGRDFKPQQMDTSYLIPAERGL
tara:strand:+ start:4080 stop:4259 length:180 start_codon:yes stop_codon:yes gene_type:complete